MAPVSVSVALQALQQDPDTQHANQSIHLSGWRTTTNQSNRAGCHKTIHQSIWQAATQNQFTCQAVTEQSFNPTERAATQQSINLTSRLQHNYQSILIHLAGCHCKINLSTGQATTQQSINLSDRLPHNYQSIHLAGCHTTINQSTWQDGTQKSIIYLTGCHTKINPPGRMPHKINSPVRPPPNNQSIHPAGSHTKIYKSI